MLKDSSDGLFDGVGITITQGSDVLRVNGCDYFLT